MPTAESNAKLAQDFGDFFLSKITKIQDSLLGDAIHKYNMSFHLYADDTQLYMTFDNNVPIPNATAQSQMKCCIEEIWSWMHLNILKLNGEKTEFLHFSPDPRHSHSDLMEAMKIRSDIISAGTEAKNLGVIFDSDFTLNNHITSVCKSANYLLYKISHIKKHLTPDALKTAIHSLVASKIDYSNSLLSGLPKYQVARLQHIMNCVARIISGMPMFEHIKPVLRTLHWLPVEFHIMFKIACLAYKVLKGQAPSYLAQAIERYESARFLRSAGQALLVVPKIRTQKYGTRSFAHAAPTIFNSLPSLVQQAPTIDAFKVRLKTHLFTLAYK